MATTNQTHPLQSIMDKLDKQIDAVAKSANDTAARINTLALTYASACREDAMSALAARLTAEPPPPRTADEAALALWEAVQQLPEIQKLNTPQPSATVVPIRSEPVATPEADYARIRVACMTKPLVVMGGPVPGDRVNWVKNRTVKSATWHLITREREQKETDAALIRITAREYGAVVLIEEDIRQTQRARLEAACMRVGVPWVLAERSNTEALASALDEMNNSLGQSVQATR